MLLAHLVQAHCLQRLCDHCLPKAWTLHLRRAFKRVFIAAFWCWDNLLQLCDHWLPGAWTLAVFCIFVRFDSCAIASCARHVCLIAEIVCSMFGVSACCIINEACGEIWHLLKWCCGHPWSKLAVCNDCGNLLLNPYMGQQRSKRHWWSVLCLNVLPCPWCHRAGALTLGVVQFLVFFSFVIVWFTQISQCTHDPAKPMIAIWNQRRLKLTVLLCNTLSLSTLNPQQ